MQNVTLFEGQPWVAVADLVDTQRKWVTGSSLSKRASKEGLVGKWASEIGLEKNGGSRGGKYYPLSETLLAILASSCRSEARAFFGLPN